MTMDEIPNDIATVVRSAASHTQGYTGGLDSVYRRARRRRTRKIVAALAVVAAGVAIALPFRTEKIAQPATPPTISQRLFLYGADGAYRTAATPGTQLDAHRIGELLPDNTILARNVTGADSWDDWTGLPDGRIVAFAPGHSLITVGEDGQVEQTHVVGARARFVTADATTAYLLRPDGLVQHDLASGAEKVMVSPTDLEAPDVLDGSIRAIDLAGDRIAIVRAKAPCDTYSQSLQGSTISMTDLFPYECQAVTDVRVSPSGRWVAIAYRTTSGRYRLTISGSIDGVPVAHAALSGPKVSLAWRDDHTLRGVFVPEGSGPHLLDPLFMVV
jgi:hypothetical protein